MSYTLQGDALNLTDIRRDAAILKDLEIRAIAAGCGRNMSEILLYDKAVTLEELQSYALERLMKSTAQRLWNGLCQFDQEIERLSASWKHGITPIGVTYPAKTIYLGQMCSPSLVLPYDYGKVTLQIVPNIGKACVDLLKEFVWHHGVQIGSTPKDWNPPKADE